MCIRNNPINEKNVLATILVTHFLPKAKCTLYEKVRGNRICRITQGDVGFERELEPSKTRSVFLLTPTHLSYMTIGSNLASIFTSMQRD